MFLSFYPQVRAILSTNTNNKTVKALKKMKLARSIPRDREQK